MLKFAIIGCGNIALRSSIPALIESPYSLPVVCIDTDISKSEVIREKFKLPFESSFEKALNNYSFNAVYISTPTGTHKELVIQAANHKKHILCEKSIATNIDEVNEMILSCKKKWNSSL